MTDKISTVETTKK